MGGPLTASDLQTHQHATECPSMAPAAPPPLLGFVLTCALGRTVGNSWWVTRTHTLGSLVSTALWSQYVSVFSSLLHIITSASSV